MQFDIKIEPMLYLLTLKNLVYSTVAYFYRTQLSRCIEALLTFAQKKIM